MHKKIALAHPIGWKGSVFVLHAQFVMDAIVHGGFTGISLIFCHYLGI